jgi:hypothetical protein
VTKLGHLGSFYWCRFSCVGSPPRKAPVKEFTSGWISHASFEIAAARLPQDEDIS